MYARAKVGRPRTQVRISARPLTPTDDGQIETFTTISRTGGGTGNPALVRPQRKPGDGRRPQGHCEIPAGVVRGWQWTSDAKLDELTMTGRSAFRPTREASASKMYLDERPGVCDRGTVWTDIDGHRFASRGTSARVPDAEARGAPGTDHQASAARRRRCPRPLLRLRDSHRRRPEAQAPLDRDRHHPPGRSISSRSGWPTPSAGKIAEKYKVVGEPRDLESARALAARRQVPVPVLGARAGRRAADGSRRRAPTRASTAGCT